RGAAVLVLIFAAFIFCHASRRDGITTVLSRRRFLRRLACGYSRSYRHACCVFGNLVHGAQIAFTMNAGVGSGVVQWLDLLFVATTASTATAATAAAVARARFAGIGGRCWDCWTLCSLDLSFLCGNRCIGS